MYAYNVYVDDRFLFHNLGVSDACWKRFPTNGLKWESNGDLEKKALLTSLSHRNVKSTQA